MPASCQIADYLLTAEEDYQAYTEPTADLPYVVYHETAAGSGSWTSSYFEDAFFCAVFAQNLENRGFNYSHDFDLEIVETPAEGAST
ncbi:hypothetical protein [Nodosilinea nodulosa]|uniref:hypothetical protein n=1 Tax=Nodosilinea nodulosa TaxID=416001 RepID=UPI0002F443E3|nr:hypothetical protein [Nodosilinea nodulosa]